MERIIPFFEVDGKRYEIKRTRYLLAEYDKLRNSANLSKEDKVNAVKAQSIIAEVQKWGKRKDELDARFAETFDSEDERKYLKAKELYDNALEELTKLEVESGSIAKSQKQGIDILEKTAILGLSEQYDMNYDTAKATWEKYVDTVGNEQATEWLSEMSECLFGSDDEVDENSFLAQMRNRRENKANIRRKK